MSGLKKSIVVCVIVAAALAAVAGAGAAPFAPASQGLPFVPLSKADIAQAPTCQGGRVCYPPQMIRDAYDFPNGRGGATGAGQTILVVDAFGSPFLLADVAAFDAQFGLADPNFTELDQQANFSPGGSNELQTWALETSLDVEWAHALAPDAKIVLAAAASDNPQDLYEVEREAFSQYPTAIVAQSFGGDEVGAGDEEGAFDSLYAQQLLHGGSVIASSGDLGATNDTIFTDTPTPMASYPASSPLVLGVGGTMGSPYPGGLWNSGHYGGEQVWNEFISPALFGASGGAPSTVYPRPIWQVGFTTAHGRAEPDVSYDAALNGGVIIAFGGGFGVIGGTSVGAPSWAAILALANELRAKARRPQVALVTPLLYLLARDKTTYRQDFHDITSGSNDLGAGQFGLPGFQAGPGYDYPTGLGTPDVARLIKDLAGRDASALRILDFIGPHAHGNGDGRFAPGH